MHNSYALIIAGVLLSKKCNRGASEEILAVELGASSGLSLKAKFFFHKSSVTLFRKRKQISCHSIV